MSNNFQGNRAPRQLTILDDFRMRLVGPVANGGERPSNFSVKVVKNRPVLEVRTNVPNDKNYGRITADLDPISFETFLGWLETIGDKEPGHKDALKVSDYPFTQQGRSKELKLQSTVIVGKENDGTVYLGVVSWDSNRPVIKFPVRPSQFHKYVKADGSPWEEAEISQVYARSYARLLRQLVYNVLQATYTPPEPRGGGNQGGGGGGYQQRQGGGGGGYQNNNQGGGNQGGGGQPAAASNNSWGDDSFPM